MRGLAFVLAIGCAAPPLPVIANVAPPAQPRPERPPAKCEPPCAQKSRRYEDRLAALECRVQCLKEQIWRAKSRVQLLRED
jgi:hypothetical protein